MIKTSSYLVVCLCLSCLKLLFLKSYVSTDFDVHRNWMAITYSLPPDEWYFDATSEWTLDYPPLFAIFELLLALGAHLFNVQQGLVLSRTPIRLESVIVYQKITVILSDFVYFYAVYKLCNSLEPLLCGAPAREAKKTAVIGAKFSGKDGAVSNPAVANPVVSKTQPGAAPNKDDNSSKQQVEKKSPSPPAQANAPAKLNLADAVYRPDASSCIALLLLFQPGLLLVDHIHFQYNGFLSGVLLLSAADIISGRFMAASFWFAVLLNLKHIYLYCAPAYGMYLLAGYCLAAAKPSSGHQQFRLLTFLFRAGRLGSIVTCVFVITYSPFADEATLRQIVGRLFPFKRGLTHAYWAPNVWSLYNLADKILSTIFKDSLKVNFDLESISKTTRITSTSGLVQEYEHLYLSCVKPAATFILVGLFTVPIVVKCLLEINTKSARLFLKSLTLAAFTSFMFGWHVHEKAILLVILPSTPLCFTDPRLRNTFLRLTLAGTYSLFPLLHRPAEYPIKVCLLIAFYSLAKSLNPACFDKNFRPQQQQAAATTTNRQYRLISWARTSTCKLYALLDKAYVVTLVMNELYIILLFGRLNHSWNPLARLNKLEFLPLMMTSTLSAVGISLSYLELFYDFVVSTADGPAVSL